MENFCILDTHIHNSQRTLGVCFFVSPFLGLSDIFTDQSGSEMDLRGFPTSDRWLESDKVHIT